VLNRNTAIIVILLLLAYSSFSSPTTGVDRATYVFEKDFGGVPAPVSYALRKLNEQGIIATELEVQPENGLGEIPVQDRIAVEAAGDALPTLVVQSGETVVKIVKLQKPGEKWRYDYARRLEYFQHRWDEAQELWQERSAALEGMRLASHHRSFSYLADWLDLDIVATLESKPGIPPSGAQLAALLEQLTPNPPAGVIRTPYENEKPSRWLSDRLDIPEIKLPFTIGGTDKAVDLFTLYDESLRMLEEYAN